MTEEEVLSIPHTDMEGMHMWINSTGRMCDGSKNNELIVVEDGDTCPYCGSLIDVYGGIHTGNWTWATHICGTKSAIGIGWRDDRPNDYVLLGISPQSIVCRAMASMLVYKEDTI